MLPGRLSPAEMFPAGRAGLSARFVELRNGLRLRVVEAGDRGRPVVLLLHGWGASAYMWRDWLAPLAAAGYRVIAPDLPGHGVSAKPLDAEAYSRDAMVSSVRLLLEHERAGVAHVVGQSMGGTIAIDLATSHPQVVAQLVLVNPATFGRVRMIAFFRRMSPTMIEAVLPRLVPRWLIARTHGMVYGDPTRVTAQDINEYWAPSQFPGFSRAMRRLLHRFDWTRAAPEEMARLLAPMADRTLVILGTRDRLVVGASEYASAVRQRLPGLRVYMADGGGHAVNEERPGDLVPRVRSFLSEHT